MGNIIKLLLSTVFCLILLSPPALAQEQDKSDWPAHLTILGGPLGGQWFILGTSIAAVLNTEVLPAASRIGGGVDNLRHISKKYGDIGLVLSCFLGASESEEAYYKTLETEHIRIIANVYPQLLYILLRKDFADRHNIKTVPDLLALEEPIRFASLKSGTASEFILSMLLKYGYNINFEQLKKQGWNIFFGSYAEISDHFVTDKLDCFAYTSSIDVPFIKKMEESVDIVILPIDEKVLSLLADRFKTNTYIIKAGDYTQATEPITTLASYTSLVVHEDLPDSLVYTILDSLFKNKETIASNIVDFNSLSPDTAIAAGLPMHDGALKFWNEMNENAHNEFLK